MKTAIASSGNKLSDPLDTRFGRCKYFLIIDDQDGSQSFVKNSFHEDEDGVGRNVVDLLLKKKVSQVISVEFGSKVKSILEKNKIQMIIIHDRDLKVQDVINKLIK